MSHINAVAMTLRQMSDRLRRQPIALSDLIPMLQQGADEIERLEDEILAMGERQE